MRAFDGRLVRLAVVAGAIVGSALVSSVAVATDESLPIEPSPTAPSDVASIDGDQHDPDVIVVDSPPGTPIEDIAVIEIVVPAPEVVELEPTGVETVAAAADPSASVDESTVTPTVPPVTAVSPEPMPADLLEATDPVAVEPEEPGGAHEGGSGGEGTPYRMTFTVVWFDADGKQITALDVAPARGARAFELVGDQPDRQGQANVGYLHLS